MATEIHPLPHLQMKERGISQEYKSRKGRGRALNVPARNRATHGSALRKQLQSFVPLGQNLQLQREAQQLDQLVPAGIVIEFQSAKGFDLAFKSLDLPSEGIELLNFKEVDQVQYATCFVPEGKLAVLAKKVREYVQTNTPKGKPRNNDLVASIQSIGMATIEAFWTDEVPLPDDDEVHWWETWLRRDKDMEAEVCLQRFAATAEILALTLAESWLAFPDRIVVNIEATRGQLAQAAELLNLIAEIRRADLPPALPHEPTLKQQDEFVDGLAARLQPPPDDAVALAILDTGINRAHPLIAKALATEDLHAVDASWGTHDHHGHGTQMAGVALYGDLRAQKGHDPVPLPYRLESVKILPPEGQTAHDLFGAVTEEAVAHCEIQAAQRARVFCKTITSQMHQDGLPSSYSAAVDQLAFGAEDDSRRLFVVAAGNVPESLWSGFPQSNLTYGVEQPGQAWNALTVGACTHMDKLPGNAAFAGWTPVASSGELSPFSATSYAWRRWPVKPEVVFEGGNVAHDPEGEVATPRSMQLLTTHRNANAKPLTHTHMTSPATAQGAGFAARLMTEYPEFWPETIKALTVHSARWTPQMRSRFFKKDTEADRLRLLRACGWGQPRLDEALHSLRHRVCIVAQEALQPYKLQGTQGKMNQLKIFALPWPKEELAALANTPVKLRVTLCYFIDPSPSKRGWLDRYRYASHFLRFDLRRNNESEQEFNKRVNAAMVEDDEELDSPADDGWFLRSKLRTYGSVHSDEWSGMAVNLMSRDLLAVYPVVGWWRTCPERGGCESVARFALVLTLEAQDTEVDLYAAIHNELQTPIAPDLVNLLET